MEKIEGKLKQAFTQELKRQLPDFIVQRFITNASPDRSITGNGVTTHWEFKHGTPAFESPGDQELMCMRLAVQGHCRYVVWQESSKGVGKRTMVLHPRDVFRRSSGSWTFNPEAWCVGYDHKWLVDEISKWHGVML